MTGPGVPPQLGPDDVAALVRSHPEWWAALGVEAPEAPVVGQLGRGESFTVWRVGRADGTPPGGVTPQLAVRVPHVPAHELPQPLEDEHAILARLPPDVGAVPVVVQAPTERDPTAYLVTSVVPGQVRPPHAWTDEHLGTLAQQLARLHVLGSTDDLGAAPSHDLVELAHASRAWWQAHEPQAATALDELWPAVLAHQEQVQATAPDAETVLVHGDACLTNVVVDGDRTRLIDWEWAGLGDPARDLAYSGGRAHADPWYAALDEQRVLRQAEAYAAARAALGRPVELEPLLVRRSGWLLHETYFVTAHLRRVAARGGPEAAHRTRVADDLARALGDWLG